MKRLFSVAMLLGMAVSLWANQTVRVDSVTVHRDCLPVLVGRLHNPILNIRVHVSGELASIDLHALTVQFDGLTDLSDLAGCAMWSTGLDSVFASQSALGRFQMPQKELAFHGCVRLKHGINHFWLSVQLAEQAQLLHTIHAKYRGAVFSDGVEIPHRGGSSQGRLRLGRALRKHGDDGVHTYRIPGIVCTPRGTLIAVYDIRRNGAVDLQADVDIGMSRSIDGGQSWAPMRVIMDMGSWGGRPEEENGIGDPAILVDDVTGAIWVAAIWAHGHPGKRNWWASRPGLSPDSTSQLMLCKSDDDGLSWSDPINITAQIKNPAWTLCLQGPGRGITMKNGTLVFPAQYKDEAGLAHSTLIFSLDRGKTWQIGTGAKANTTEAQVVELVDGSLMLNMRDNRGGTRSVYITRDLGRTWLPHATSRKALIEPVCNAGLIRTEENVLLFINPRDTSARQNMTIQASLDQGLSWPAHMRVLLDEGRGRGYASLTMIDKNHVGVLYESSQADLVFQILPLRDIIGVSPVKGVTRGL